jgi:hypothetical protein
MPTARTRRKSPDKDLLARLADAGEEALSRVGELPGGHRLVETVNGLRERLDELQSRLRSLDPLERRVTALEKRLAGLEGQRRPASRRKPPGPKQPAP